MSFIRLQGWPRLPRLVNALIACCVGCSIIVLLRSIWNSRMKPSIFILEEHHEGQHSFFSIHFLTVFNFSLESAQLVVIQKKITLQYQHMMLLFQQVCRTGSWQRMKD